MSSWNIPLFFGVKLNHALDKLIHSSNPHQVSFFLNDPSGNYLQHMNINGDFYIGKCLDQVVDFQDLLLLNANIQSILSNVIGSFNKDACPIILLALSPVKK